MKSIKIICISIFFVFVGSLFLVGCSFFYNTQMTLSNIVNVENKKNLWTFLIYMAADNELESAALNDINELEAACAISDNVRVLVLLDKKGDGEINPEGGSILYQIKNDERNSFEIISSPITCLELGLDGKNKTGELNMASSNTLETLIDYVKSSFPSEKYGLIMWGHGTGYRSDFAKAEGSLNYKGFAVDDTSNSFMSNRDFRQAIENKGLSIIGFDTCFGMLLETLYEIKDCGKHFIGSASLVPANGWDYYTLFSSFAKKEKETLASKGDLGKELNEDFFCALAETQFYNQYEALDGFKISHLDLRKVVEINLAFEEFVKTIADYVVDKETQREVLSIIDEDVNKYSAFSYPCDIFLDLFSFGVAFEKIAPKESEKLRDVLSENGEILNIGVYYITKKSSNLNMEKHENYYIKNSVIGNDNELLFIKENINWVPNYNPGNSLLDKLFYTNY